MVLFVDENNDRTKVKQDDKVTSIRVVVKMTIDFIYNKKMIRLLLFMTACVATNKIGFVVWRAYLIRDLGYNQARMSVLNAISTPLQVFATTYLSKYAYDTPLTSYSKYLTFFSIFQICLINLILYNYGYLVAIHPLLLDL